MSIKNKNREVAFFLLTLFLSLKALGLHVFAHDCDESQDLQCTICSASLNNNLEPALNPDNSYLEITKTESLVERVLSCNQLFIYLKTVEINQLFSRPPPAFV